MWIRDRHPPQRTHQQNYHRPHRPACLRFDSAWQMSRLAHSSGLHAALRHPLLYATSKGPGYPHLSRQHPSGVPSLLLVPPHIHQRPAHPRWPHPSARACLPRWNPFRLCYSNYPISLRQGLDRTVAVEALSRSRRLHPSLKLHRSQPTPPFVAMRAPMDRIPRSHQYVLPFGAIAIRRQRPHLSWLFRSARSAQRTRSHKHAMNLLPALTHQAGQQPFARQPTP